MLQNIRIIIAIALAAGIIWNCGSERVTQSEIGTEEQIGRPLSKLAAQQKAVIIATVQQDDAPVSGAKVEFARSIAGQKADYQWSGMTDENGQARIEITAGNGYYQARASQDGIEIGSWSSIPINEGYGIRLNLPIGEKAELTSEGLPAEITIGVVLPLTGQLGTGGQSLIAGFDLAREEINRSSLLGGAKINFIMEDNRSTPEGSVEAYNKLIHRDGVSVIIGPYTSSATSEAFPIAQQNEVVAISPTSASPGLSAMGDFLFRASLTVNWLIPGGVRTTHEQLGYQKAATIFQAGDVFAQNSDAIIKETLHQNGVEVLTTESFQVGQTDFSEQLTRIKESNPDAIFLSALPITEANDILIQTREIGIPPEVHFITQTLTPGEIERAGAAAEGAISFTAWTSTADTPGNRAFVDNYTMRAGVEPSAFTAQSYATVHILSNAIANAQSIDSRAIRDALAKTRDLDTILGKFSFDANGDGVYNPVVLIVRNGKLEVFSSSPQKKEIPIGVVLPLTGHLATLSPARKNSLELAREEINQSPLLGGARIEFIIEDNGTTPEGTIAAYNKLIHRDGVSVIIGPFASTTTREAFPIAQQNQIVAISPTSAAQGLSEIGDFVFRSALTVDRVVPGGVKTTHEKLGYQRVATIYQSDDVFSQSSNEAILQALQQNGVEVITTETFQTGDTDFSEQLTRIKELNLDAIFLSALPIEKEAVLIQVRQIGIPTEVHFITLALTAGNVQRAGPAAEGAISITAWSSMSDTPGNRAFVENYTAKYNSEPDEFVAQSYTTVHILANAIAAAPSTDSEAIRDAMANIRNLDTILGTFSFDPNGDAIYNPIILIVRNGKFEVFNP